MSCSASGHCPLRPSDTCMKINGSGFHQILLNIDQAYGKLNSVQLQATEATSHLMHYIKSITNVQIPYIRFLSLFAGFVWSCEILKTKDAHYRFRTWWKFVYFVGRMLLCAFRRGGPSTCSLIIMHKRIVSLIPFKILKINVVTSNFIDILPFYDK
jgi:hypothetical protein